jgi:hypothetical protein
VPEGAATPDKGAGIRVHPVATLAQAVAAAIPRGEQD